MSQLLLFLIIALCTISLFIIYLIQRATHNGGIRRLLYIILALAMMMGMYQLHRLWPVPTWGQWVLSFGLPLTFFAVVGVIMMLIDVVINRQLSAITFDIQQFVAHVKSFIPNLKSDFWQFTKYCVIDENDSATQHLFDDIHHA